MGRQGRPASAIAEAGRTSGTQETGAGARQDQQQEKMREYRRKWYATHSEMAKAKVGERRAELLAYLHDLLSAASCAQCGESHPACLDLYVAGPAGTAVTSTMIRQGWSKERIADAVKRGRVLCSNCHEKATWPLRMGQVAFAAYATAPGS
jgi:hypothetical protein